jgi:hypothetical protein
MVDITSNDKLEGILPDLGMLADDHPETVIANLPSTLIVSALEDQLTKAANGYTDKDYLTPIVDATKMLSNKYSGDSDVVSSISTSLDAILSRVVSAISREWNTDFSQIGLDPNSPSYVQDVVELYRFFVVDRINLSIELLFHIIVSNRKKLVDQYRKSVEKKNQTVSEARRVFQQFEDVVIWIAMPQIFNDIKNSSAWDFSFEESLDVLNVDYSSKFLYTLASMWVQPEFSSKYCAVALTEDNELITESYIRNGWLTSAPKKAPDNTDNNEQETE